jgi:hypothetical protein
MMNASSCARVKPGTIADGSGIKASAGMLDSARINVDAACIVF